MWLLQLFPSTFLEIIVHGILLVGIILTSVSILLITPLIRFFPRVSEYYRLVQILSVVILSVGVYLQGGYNTEMIWRQKVTELENKIKIAEEESDKVNEDIQAEVNTNVKNISERSKNIIKHVDRVVIKYEKQCPIPQEIIDIHNEAVNMNKLQGEIAKEELK